MLAGLITQYAVGATNLYAYMNAIGDQLNDIEECLGQLLDNLCLQNAVGVQLDGLGYALGQGRDGLGDEDYRALLQARIASLQAQGTVEDIIQIFKTLASCEKVQVIELYPAAFRVIMTNPGTPVLSNADIVAAVMTAKAGGVRAELFSVAKPAFKLDDPATDLNDGLDTGYFPVPFTA